MEDKIAIIGDGGMGTVCAIILAENGLGVRLWSAFDDAADELSRRRENVRFLPGYKIPDGVEIVRGAAGVFDECSLAVNAVPVQFMRSVWSSLAAGVPDGLSICSVSKGIETETLLRPTQVLRDVLDGDADSARRVSALSGPSIAPELADKLPAGVTVSSDDSQLCKTVQRYFSNSYFRVYTNSDLLGVEISGATKNVIAIAAGILDGLHAGDNAKAFLVTRGLSEISRLGVKMGAARATFSGLAGVGDLVTTCVSPSGRNRSFGQAIGSGKSVKEALSDSRGVVEGVATTQSVVELAKKYDIEMPITQAIHTVIFEGVRPAEAIEKLMARPLKSEG